MEYTYGINVANRYVLLLDEPEDVPKILKDEEKEKEAKKAKTKKNLISEKENKGDGNQKEKGTPGGKKTSNEDRNAKIMESGGVTQDVNKKGNNQKMQKGQQHVKFAAEVYEERNNARNFREKSPYQRSSFNRDSGNEASERDSGDDAPAEGGGNYTFRGRGRGRGGRGRGRGAGAGGGAGGGGFGRVFSRGGRGGFRRYGADGNNQQQQQQQPYENRDGNQSGDFYNQEKQQSADNDDSEVWDDGEEKPKPVAEEPLDWASDIPEAYIEPPKEEDAEDQTQDTNAEDSGGEPNEPARTLLTLDEYKALKGNREKPKYNLRRAGEGEDLSQWQNMHVLKNKLADVESEEEEEKYDPADYPQRVGRQKHILDINIQFKDAPRRGTRGRGRARGGRWAGSRGRGDGARFDNSESDSQDQDTLYERSDRFDRPGSFSQRTKQHTVTICNENEFPSLA